jgi:glycosyltransferase involved in cell wall biosynthesis
MTHASAFENTPTGETTRRVRVLFAQNTSAVGGVGRSLLGILAELDRDRFEPTVLFLDQPSAIAAEAERLGAQVRFEPGIVSYGHGNGARPRFYRWPPWLPFSLLMRFPASVRRARAVLGELRPDLVYLNAEVMVPMMLACRSLGIRPIIHARTHLHTGRFGLRFRLYRWLIETTAAHLITLSHATAAQYAGRCPTTVIYNAVSFARFDRTRAQAAARAALGLARQPGAAADGPLVLMLGGSNPHKGAHVLVDALAVLRRTHPAARVAILGFHPMPPPTTWKNRVRQRLAPGHAADLQRQIARLGLNDAVLLLGSRDDVPEWLAACDVLTFPATEDHFARPVIEASAMARPSVASDGPNLRELIAHEVTGLLVPPNSPAALAAAIARILDDPAEAAAMGERAYADAVTRFDLRDQRGAIRAVIEAVLAGQAAEATAPVAEAAVSAAEAAAPAARLPPDAS